MKQNICVSINDKVYKEYFMNTALTLASKSLDDGEFPVGCVIVCQNEIIATGRRINTSFGNSNNEIDHAEMIALRKLAQSGFSNNKNEITIYSTLEPCLMCFAAIILSGINHIVYGYEDVMGGGTNCDRTKMTMLYKESPISIIGGVQRKESLLLFKTYFSCPENSYWKNSVLSEYTLKTSGKI